MANGFALAILFLFSASVNFDRKGQIRVAASRKRITAAKPLSMSDLACSHRQFRTNPRDSHHSSRTAFISAM